MTQLYQQGNYMVYLGFVMDCIILWILVKSKILFIHTNCNKAMGECN